MTLIVAVHTPEFIVLAADGQEQKTNKSWVNERCETVPEPPPNGKHLLWPSVRTSEANKLCFFYGRYVIGVAGNPYLGSRPILSILSDLGQEWTSTGRELDMSAVITEIGHWLIEKFERDIPEQGAQSNTTLVLSGFSNDLPHSWKLPIAKFRGLDCDWEMSCKLSLMQPGFIYEGEDTVVEAVSKIWKTNEHGFTAPLFKEFHEQDAVDCASFLIGVTGNVHRFCRSVPGVNGPVNVAAIARSGDLRWVKKKELEVRDPW